MNETMPICTNCGGEVKLLMFKSIQTDIDKVADYLYYCHVCGTVVRDTGGQITSIVPKIAEVFKQKV